MHSLNCVYDTGNGTTKCHRLFGLTPKILIPNSRKNKELGIKKLRKTAAASEFLNS